MKTLLLLSLVLLQDALRRLGLVLHGFLVHGVGLVVQAALLELLSPGHVESGRPGADAFAEDVAVQSDRVRVVAGLQDGQRDRQTETLSRGSR